MSNGPSPLHGVTEAKGAYNRHSETQAAGSSLALPLLEQAASRVVLDNGEDPVVIADYGSSQGRNSLMPIRAALKILRARLAPHRPILVTHVDVAANDFSTLFDVLESDPNSYLRDEPDIFPSAIGRSFYRSVFPPEHVHLAWSSYAAVWLSRAPTSLPGHFWIQRSTGAVHAAFAAQAAEDWADFLTLRAGELRRGGRLVVVLPALLEEMSPRMDVLMDHANAVLAEMVEDGAITFEEHGRMLLLSYPRRKSELLAPFAAGATFESLVLEQYEEFRVPDPAWPDYQRRRDPRDLASRHARFFRATFAPTLAGALQDRSVEMRQLFHERLEGALVRRLAEQPAPLDLGAHAIVLAKREDMPRA